jgi:hypothetical protein
MRLPTRASRMGRRLPSAAFCLRPALALAATVYDSGQRPADSTALLRLCDVGRHVDGAAHLHLQRADD